MSAALHLPPGPSYPTPLHFFREFKEDPLAYYQDLIDTYGDIP